MKKDVAGIIIIFIIIYGGTEREQKGKSGRKTRFLPLFFSFFSFFFSQTGTDICCVHEKTIEIAVSFLSWFRFLLFKQ